MNDDRVERLLRGYQLPEPPHALDRRVIEQAEQVLMQAGTRAAIADIAREFANVLGFGYVSYIVDVVTASDAEYRVELV